MHALRLQTSKFSSFFLHQVYQVRSIWLDHISSRRTSTRLEKMQLYVIANLPTCNLIRQSKKYRKKIPHNNKLREANFVTRLIMCIFN